jgi:hypothetical protein
MAACRDGSASTANTVSADVLIVVVATYLNSTTWGSSSGQVFALIGAMFSAFLAGSATVHIGAKAGQATSSPAS